MPLPQSFLYTHCHKGLPTGLTDPHTKLMYNVMCFTRCILHWASVLNNYAYSELFFPSYRFLHYASTSAFVVVLEAGEQGKRPRNQPTRSIFTIFCCLKIITACLRCCSELLPNFPFKEQYSIPAFACLICGYYPVHCSHSKMMSC